MPYQQSTRYVYTFGAARARLQRGAPAVLIFCEGRLIKVTKTTYGQVRKDFKGRIPDKAN